MRRAGKSCNGSGQKVVVSACAENLDGKVEAKIFTIRLAL